MTLPPLTKRQREIVDFFQAYVRSHSISPTLEEIAQAMGVNKVTVFGHVSELERKGILKKTARGISRSLKLSPRRAPSGAQFLAGRCRSSERSQPGGPSRPSRTRSISTSRNSPRVTAMCTRSAFAAIL
jgi:SOS-response transcriptional repressor LexA